MRRVDRCSFCCPHDHDFIEIVLVVRGTGWQDMVGQRQPITSGTLTILRPGHWHGYSDCQNMVIYNCLWGIELLRRELAWLIDEPKLARLLWGAGAASGHPDHTPSVFRLEPPSVKRLETVLEMSHNATSSSYAVKISLLSLFLTTLAEELPGLPLSEGRLMPPSVVKSIRLIDSDLARDWTVGELADTCGCCSEYLIRQFKASIGITPYAYISRCRVERAASLLLRTDDGVAQIAEQVGWGELSHFARRFKQYYGISASAYRQQMREAPSTAHSDKRSDG